MDENTRTDNLPERIKNKRLRIIDKEVAQSIPVHEAAALTMLSTNDILDLGLIAHSNSPR